MKRTKAVEIEIADNGARIVRGESNTISNRSQTRSKKATTIFRSEPRIDGPFYSHAMRCWRVQYYERGLTYHYSRESSLYIERLEDAQVIVPIVREIKTWEAWQGCIALIKEVLASSATGGYCYVTGLPPYGREALHRDNT